MDTADSRGAPSARYQRPYAVPEKLDLLRGPSSGTVRLPSYLDWSGNAVYDLDAPGRVVDLYRAVLIEAASPQDLYAYLDDGVLRRLWALLWLPAQLRKAWEQRFPILAEISRITATALAAGAGAAARADSADRPRGGRRGTGSRWRAGARSQPTGWLTGRAAMWTCLPAGSTAASSPS